MKHIEITLVLCVQILALLPSQVSAMEVTATDTEPYTLHLMGEIIKGDHKRIVHSIQEKGSFPLSVYISSPGGDVMEAARIGRFLRDTLLHIYAVNECSSACVLIWAGGVERDATAIFGLHRPIYDKSYFAGLSALEARKKYSELDEFTRAYLTEMNIPTSVVDRMMSTKSSDVDLVTPIEFLEMTGRSSPAYQEWIIAKCGELSTSEQKDYSATVKLSMVNELTKWIGTDEEKEFYKDIIEQNNDEAKYALSLSSGYRDYLTNKMKDISECTQKAQSTVRDKVISGE